MMSRILCMSAVQRTVVRKPFEEIRRGTMNGKTTPPKLLSAATIPVASPRFDENHCVVNTRVGREMPELAVPKATPCASMICQYFVQRLNMQTAKIARTEKGMLIRRAPWTPIS
jgi:hypothetical protein